MSECYVWPKISWPNVLKISVLNSMLAVASLTWVLSNTRWNFIHSSTSLIAERIFLHYSFKLLAHTCGPTTDILHRLLRITLHQPHLCICVFSWETHIPTGQPVNCIRFPRLYEIYRLAINQSKFSKPGLYELVI